MLRLIALYSSLIFICGFSGVNYHGYTHNAVTKIHVLVLDPHKVTLNIVCAQDLGHSLATVSEIAQHSGAIAAINGGFFRVNAPISGVGLPAGILKINHRWHGITYKPRGAMAWNPATNQVLFDIVQTDSKVEIGNQALPIHAMNKVLDGSRASIFSDSYVDHLQIKDNLSFLIKDGHISEIYSRGSILIPPGTYVYNVSGLLLERVRNVNTGDPARLHVITSPLLERTTANAWMAMPNIIGGGPLLIKHRAILPDYNREQLDLGFAEQRYARTAIGVLENGDLILVVVEKSLLNDDSGMTLPELARFMLERGCTEALNLDGGGSSAMYLNPNIASRWSLLLTDRPVANALVVVAKPESL